MGLARPAARPVPARKRRSRDTIAPIVKIRASVLAALVPALLLAGLLGREFYWRSAHDLLKPQASAPDGAHVAEVRGLPQARGRASGVYLRGRYAWLRSLSPRLVFAGDCEEVDTRWFGPHRLVIDCQLRSGEPQLLQDVVDGVAIEVLVERQFALTPAQSERISTLRNLIGPPGRSLAPSPYCSAIGPCANLLSSTSTVRTPLSTTVRWEPRAVIS